jgi:glutathione-specific gamma-glutamylcyclotransferase
MPTARRQMALTPNMVARVHRAVADADLDPDFIRNTAEDHAAAVRKMLASHPEGDDVWVFAYGSLLWKPEVEHVEERIGTARGWHRSFRLRLRSWRGTREVPGLMMGLDRGGQCKGVAYRLAGHTVEVQLGKLFRREMPVRPLDRPPTNVPRWITVETDQGRIRAIAFVINRSGHAYAGGLTPEQTADILATACGHGGSCAEYLYNTVSHLEERGICDRNLWRLQALVADRIASLAGLARAKE